MPLKSGLFPTHPLLPAAFLGHAFFNTTSILPTRSDTLTICAPSSFLSQSSVSRSRCD